MTASKTATVETLTAEVRVLMVGSRQVTMSVYGQLDDVGYDEIEPFGRVAPKDAQDGFIYVIGKRTGAADLVTSWLPVTESRVKRWVAEQSSAAAYQRSAENEDRRASQCEQEALGLENAAEQLSGKNYINRNDYTCTSYGAGHHDAETQRREQQVTEYDQKASAEGDEIGRLKALADAAAGRHCAAESRKHAADARAEAASLRAKAHDSRTRKTVHESNARAHWASAGKWTEWESREIETVTAEAARWEALPLIVLAGLR